LSLKNIYQKAEIIKTVLQIILNCHYT